jgi:chaperonin cofactor prefoldin
MSKDNFLKNPPNDIEVFEGEVKTIEDMVDILTDKGEYLQDILYHMYYGKKVRVTIEIMTK